MKITTQKELRRLFWEQHPSLPRRRIRDYSGKGKMYPTDTRVSWVDWLDFMQKEGCISQALADRATLDAFSVPAECATDESRSYGPWHRNKSAAQEYAEEQQQTYRSEVASGEYADWRYEQ